MSDPAATPFADHDALTDALDKAEQAGAVSDSYEGSGVDIAADDAGASATAEKIAEASMGTPKPGG